MVMRIALTAGFRAFHLTAASARGQDRALRRVATRDAAQRRPGRTKAAVAPATAFDPAPHPDKPTPFAIRT